MTALELPLLADQRAAERHPARRPHGPAGAHLRHDAEPGGADRAARLLAARRPRRRCWRRRWRWSARGRSGCWRPPRPSPGAPPPSTSRCWPGRRAGGRPRRHHRHRRLRRAGRGPARAASPALRGILLCGGNQIRLVETLLHRGEESAVLRADRPRPRREGAALIAASGAASALSGVMIAGGSSYEALRYGVSSRHRPPRPGHPGGDRALRRRHRRPEPDRRQPARAAGRRLRRGERALRHRHLRGQRRDRLARRHAARGGRAARLRAGRDRPDDAGAAERQLRRQRHPADGARARRRPSLDARPEPAAPHRDAGEAAGARAARWPAARRRRARRSSRDGTAAKPGREPALRSAGPLRDSRRRLRTSIDAGR